MAAFFDDYDLDLDADELNSAAGPATSKRNSAAPATSTSTKRKRKVQEASAEKVLRVGTDFSGMETPTLAFEALGIKHVHSFSSEKNVSAQKVIKQAFSPRQFFPDVALRDVATCP